MSRTRIASTLAGLVSVTVTSVGAGPGAAPTPRPAPAGERLAVTIAGMSYEGTYTAGQTVRIYRAQPANIVVSGANLQFARASEIVTRAGGPAVGLTATIIGRQVNQITVLVNSAGTAAFGDYDIRIRFPLEPSGPDVFRVRLFQRGTITSLAVEGADPDRLAVGTAYTLVATGSNLDRMDCCWNPDTIFSLSPVSRTSTSARFRLVMKAAYGREVKAAQFFDQNLGSPPDDCRTACALGSGRILINGVVVPRITSVTPHAPASGTAVTINGSQLAPFGYTKQLQYINKYHPMTSSARQELTPSGTDDALRFSAPGNMRTDSIMLLYTSTSRDAEQMLTRSVSVPPIFVTGAPAIAGTGSVLASTAPGRTSGSAPYFLLTPGTATILGQHLLSAPAPVTSVTRTTTTITTIDRGTLTGGTTLVAMGSPLPPTVSFNGTALTVQSAAYEPRRAQPVLSGAVTTMGADRVTVTVPDLGTNQSGTVSVMTAAGTATLPNVIFASAPRITRVEEVGNPTGSGTSNHTLIRGAQYVVTGSAFELVKNEFGGLTKIQSPTLKVNGASIPLVTNSVSQGGTRLTFDLPATASSGTLTIATAGGVANAGTFTVIDAPVAPTLGGFVLSPNPVVGGAATTATVAFSGTIPTDGSAGQVIVTVPSADQSVVPAVAAIPIRANPLIFQIPTRPVSTARTVRVDVSLSASNATSSGRFVALAVNPPQPTGLSVTPGTVTGGQSATGTVQVDASIPSSAGLPVALASSDPTTVAVPATAIINGTAATFTATTTPVTSPRTVTLTASIAGVSRAFALTVVPPALAGVSLAASRVVSGRPTTGTVTFTAPVSGAVVQLASSDASVSVPATVTATGTTATFNVQTGAVPASRAVTISATANGVTKAATLTLDPLVMQSVAVSPTTVPAGGTATVTVRLSAPSVGTTQVEMTSSDTTAAVVPKQAFFQDGQNVTVVALTAKSPLAASKTVTVTGKLFRVIPTNALGIGTSSVAESSAAANVTVTP